MMNSLKSHKDKMKKNQEKGRRLKVITLLCSLFVVGAVLWGLILPGIAMSGKTYCGLEEHTHTEDCYTTELTCGQEESQDHIHSDACYSQVLTCDKEEHTHTDICQSNPEADVETAENWEASLADSGYEEGENWNQKVTAIAESQLGYAESQDNFILGDDNSHKGYTRYGAWATATTDYGIWTAEDMTYSDWDSLLTAFALKYAGVDASVFPVYSDVNAWMDALKAADLFGDASSNYQAGDLVFFNKTGDQETLFQVGIIDIVGTNDNGTNTTVTVIQGNDGNTVKETTYQVTDSQILGYGLVSKAWEDSQGGQETGDASVKNTEETGNTENTQDTEEAENTENSEDVVPVSEGTEGTVDERVVVNVTAKDQIATGDNGQTLYVTVNSRCSNPNITDPVKVKISISALPEGVTLAGFSDGKMTVHYGNNNEQTMDVELITENGQKYVKFTQPAGATISFDMIFNSKNGIMGQESKVTITPTIEKKTDKDSVSNPVTLTWTGKNVWQNLQKSVNERGKTSSKISVSRDVNDKDQLDGKLTYYITAEHSNGGDKGNIWTKEVTITDTLTLPDGMDFPEGTKVDNSNKTIVDSSGNVLFSFSNLDKDKITGISLNEKIITYTVTIPNPNMDNGVPTKEMDNINLQCELDVSKFVVKNNYTSQDQADQDKIVNKAEIVTTAYKGDELYKDNKSVESTPELKTGFKLTKTADKEGENVAPGETITYTITVNNTGNLPMSGTDEKGNTLYVTDKLPEYLVLTDAQKKSITEKGATIENDGTIKWAPGQIKAGETKTFEFKINVESMEDMKTVPNGKEIVNKASYNGSTDDSKVKYKKPDLEIKKTSSVNGKISNGDIITYTVTIENKENYETLEQRIEDTLPNGLIFQNMLDRNGNTIPPSTVKFNAKSSTADSHDVTFVQEGQKLTWLLGKLAAKEKVTLYYTCKVYTDQMNPGTTSITNNVESKTTGEKDSCSGKVENPISVDKKVNGADGGETYSNGSVLSYSVTIKNAEDEKASTRTDITLTDTMAVGLIPKGYKLYTLKSGSWGAGLTQDNLQEVNTSFSEYVKGLDYNNYYTIINNEVVKVNIDWGSNDLRAVKLTWYIGSMSAGQSITKNYQAKLYMTDSQIASGDKCTYKNTVTGGGDSDSVIIYGQADCGTIKLTKQVKGDIKYDNLTDEQKQAIKFKITYGNSTYEKEILAAGFTKNESVYEKEVSLAEFTRSDSGSATYNLSKLPYGTYKIEETSSNLDGYKDKITIEGGDTKKVTGDTVSVTLSKDNNKQTAEIKIKNEYETTDAAKVDIQKSVWEIRDQKVDLYGNASYAGLSNKKIFDKSSNTGQNAGNYVIYNISVINTGDKSVTIKDLVDELPEGLEFVGIRGELWNTTTNDFSDSTYTNQDNGKTSLNRDNLVGGKYIKVLSKDSNSVNFQIGGSNGMELEKGKAISFFVMCKVDSDVSFDVPLENTAKLLVDSDVEYKEYGEIKMKGTTNDSYQNNGGTTDEGINSDGKRVISSSVSITPAKVVVPGIKKIAKAYIATGKTGSDMIDITDANKRNNIQPNSTVKWEIELLNDGTIPINEYKIKDTVDSPFHILKQTEATELEVTDAKYKVFYIEIKNGEGRTVKSKNLSSMVWEQIGDNKVQSFELQINDSDLTIPEGGKAVFTVYTKNDDWANAIYNNDAVFTPTVDSQARFDANSVTNGELVKNNNGEYIGVKASDSVYALGDYGSFSWKTIAEKSNASNSGVGYDLTNNFISIDDENTDRMVVYSNNIENVSKNDFHGMVITDLMPYEGDTGVLNQNGRNSQFTVEYAGSMKIYLKKLETDPNPTRLTNYTIKYSSKTRFTSEEMRGNLGSEWHDTWQIGDKSFCIVMNSDFVLEPGYILTAEYEGKIGDDANPGEIAWNSFGYRYLAKNTSATVYTELRAEPPKVGVKIPISPIISKKVVDSTGKDKGTDTSKTFTFNVYEGNTVDETKLKGSFTLYQGEAKKISSITGTDGKAIFRSGETYTLVEVVDSSYTFQSVKSSTDTSATSNNNGYTFNYNSTQDSYSITFTNQLNEYKLPGTGGIGTIPFLVSGAALMCLAALLFGYNLKRKRR